MCLFLNHLITKRSPLPAELKASSPPNHIYFFQKVTIQVCPPREAQSCGCSHPWFRGGGGTSVQSRPREREVKGRARQSSGGLEAAPECSSRSSGAAPLQGV